MTSKWPQHQAELETIPGGTSSAVTAAQAPGELVASGKLLANVGDTSGIVSRVSEPIRRNWWMKHLSLLTVLQAACLAFGLFCHSDGLSNRAAAGFAPFLLTFSCITLIQGSLGYVIFSRLYCKYQIQQTGITEQLRSQQSALRRTRDAVVLGLTRMAESRDDDTEGHLERVGMLAGKLAEAAGSWPEFRTAITSEFVRLIRFSATLHDIGKVGIEDSILQKPGSLTADERERMQRHTRISSSWLQEIETCLGDANFLQMAHEIALCHHERWDGSGYPAGMSHQQIPLAARIVSIVDVYDALAAKRPYKEPYDHDRCVAIITAGKGSQFDPRLIEVFLEIQDDFREVAAFGDTVPKPVATDDDSRQPVLTQFAGLEPHSMPARELERILAEVNAVLTSSDSGSADEGAESATIRV